MALRRRRSAFRRYTSIFTVVVALIGFFISSFLRKPKIGLPINNERYVVDLELFETIINTKSKDGSHKTVVNQLLSTFIQSSYDDSLLDSANFQEKIDKNINPNNQSRGNIVVKKSNKNIKTISDVIMKAGGITSRTDLSRIEIIRDVPIGKGGGKKKAIINLNSYINELDFRNDIRVFDGDSIFFPKLSKANSEQISKSILSGISPKFILVNLFGRVETPGVIKLPLEATLSDAIDVTGPIKPLSGKIVLIRYEKDGKVLKKNISYSASAKRGSRRNPFLKEDDLITVQNSFFGKSTEVITEITSPFVGIYSTQQLIKGLTD